MFGGVVAVTQVSAAQTDEESSGEGSDTCDDSELGEHDGFADSEPACIATEFGEINDAEDNPSLLIISAPQQVEVGEQFSIVVSTRNLVRDLFPPAAEGGYYTDRATLDEDGLVRGHFHTACRMLTNTVAAPEPDPEPAAFAATEDGGGGEDPDQVSVVIDGLPDPGLAQCAVWAGDASHRIPMMSRPDQIPAFDVVRVSVLEGDGEVEDEESEDEESEDEDSDEESEDSDEESEDEGSEDEGSEHDHSEDDDSEDDDSDDEDSHDDDSDDEDSHDDDDDE